MGSDDSGFGPRRDRGAAVFLLLLILIGSTTATAAKFAVNGLPLGLLPLARFGIAGLVLLPVAFRGGALARMLREDRWRLVAASAACVPVNQAFFLSGTKLAPTSHVGVIYATCPLVVLLLAWGMGQERLIARRLVGVVASVLGVAVIGVANLWKAGPESFSTLMGDLLLVGAVTSWGVYLTLNKPLVGRYGALPTLAGTFLMGSVLQLPITLVTFPGIDSLRGVPPSAWGGLVYLGLVVSVGGLFCQNMAMRRLDASQVATVGNASPILTIVWGIWLLGEAVTPALIAGAGLTLGGILWASRPERRPQVVIPSEPEVLVAL